MNAQDKELEQLHDRMVDDVENLVEKYTTIVGWDVPENDEKEAKRKINKAKDDKEKVKQVIKEAGYDFTDEELEKAKSELSDDDLDNVAGAGAPHFF